MHDDTIDRTTNGTGAVASMTLAQIQKYKIDTYYSETAIPNSSDYTNIPSLDEVFNEFKDKDIVLVVEIKSYEEELVKQLKTLVNKYDMADNMVVITFANNQLVNMKNILPEIPTASLTSVEESVFTNTLVSMATSNCGYDGHYGTSTESYVRKLALRGYSSWFWTYQRESNIWVGMYTGTLGITNNEANEIADYAVRIEFKDDVLISSRNNYTKMQGTIAKYDSRFNETKLVSIAEKEEYDGYAHIIYKYTYSNSGRYYVVFSDKMLVLTKSLSEDINQLPEILNKDVKALTEDEVAILERLDAIAVDLEEKGVTTVDSEAIHKKLLEYQDSLTEDDDDQNQNDNQNPGDNQDPDDNITDDNNNDNVNPDEGEQDTENNKNEENDGEKEKPNLTPTTMSIGCSGSVMTSFFGLLTLAAAVIFFKKKSK